MMLTLRNFYRFGLDFSKLSAEITKEGTRNYKIPSPGKKPIPGYLTNSANSDNGTITEMTKTQIRQYNIITVNQYTHKMQGRFDDMFMAVCREVGGIEGLLNTFFDFLLRKTDFFYECDPGDTMGFPPGANSRIVYNAFKKCQDEHYKRFPKKDPQEFEEKLKKYKQKMASKNAPKAQQEQSSKSQSVATTSKQSQLTSKPEEPAKQAPMKPSTKVQIAQKAEVHSTTTTKLLGDAKSSEAVVINTHNGGETEKYKWSQDSTDVEVTIEIPKGLVAKELLVELKLQNIKITNKKDGSVIAQGELYEKINVGDSVWRVENSGNRTFVILSLEKAQERIWSTVFKGDKEIDTTKVDNSKPLNSFDPETQGALRKIMYQQQRKMQGLPTTQEEKQLQALKKAWDAEGSPFKGQPFDPSKFNLQGSQFGPQ